MLVYAQNSHTSVVGMRGAARLETTRNNGGDGAESAAAAAAPTFLCLPVDAIVADILEISSQQRQGAVDATWLRRRCRSVGSSLGGLGETRACDDENVDDDENGACCTGRCCCNNRVNKNLLVLPVECNFGGDRPNVQLALQTLRELDDDANNNNKHQQQQDQQWYTMLDLAKAASTSPVNLCELNPDFACISFYKMFGEPTGLGCLFVKRTAIDVLMRKDKGNDDANSSSKLRGYFGGGSVDAILPGVDFAVRRTEPTPLAALTNGTVHFRGIAALLAGFDELDRVGGMHMIRRHSTCLANELVRRLRGLRHGNGLAAVTIYGAWKSYGDSSALAFENGNNSLPPPGPTVAFNVLRADGSFVGYNEVSKLAALNRPAIQLRTGCFCNPGACQVALNLTDDEVISNYRESGHVCGDQIDVVNGRPTGAIRASFGKDSMWEDLDALVEFLERIFVNKGDPSSGEMEGLLSSRRWDGCPTKAIISELYMFPIKSCAAQRVKSWQLDSASGRLRFDREFALVDASGTAMRLQTYPKMALLRPEIDLNENTMTIAAPDQSVLFVSLNSAESKHVHGTGVVKVCGNRCAGMLWGDYAVSEWFSRFLGVRCWLARYSAERGYNLPEAAVQPRIQLRDPQVAFANEQPLLLISERAVDILNDVLISQNQKPVSSRHFRPNIVVRLIDHPVANFSQSHHLEDGWSRLQILGQDATLDVAGPCARCSMVDVDPLNGSKGKTLRALAGYRRSNGQITFGIFLRGAGIGKGMALDSEWIFLQEGDLLSCE